MAHQWFYRSLRLLRILKWCRKKSNISQQRNQKNDGKYFQSQKKTHKNWSKNKKPLARGTKTAILYHRHTCPHRMALFKEDDNYQLSFVTVTSLDTSSAKKRTIRTICWMISCNNDSGRLNMQQWSEFESNLTRISSPKSTKKLNDFL